MKTISLVVNSISDKSVFSSIAQQSHLLQCSSKIVILFVAKERWFTFNDPRSILASMETMNHSEKVGRKNIISYLNEIEKNIQEVNKKIEIVKIVVFGEEKYKVSKCLRLLKVEMCLLKLRKRSLISKLFTKPIHEFINEDLSIPVVLL